ncbi:MAG: hypothetical protein M1820_005371 [Bogoriella megaspora]|nr:MAG: hypothetical protein M1820_005371 [Bogoriella megaspora]
MSIQWPDDSIFEPFIIFEGTYKVVSSHEIKAAVLRPKTLQPGSHLVILFIHGGFWITGHSLFAPFFPKAVLSLALKHSAIIVSPDYRLLPTENGMSDILDDLEDFWKWSRSGLPALLANKAPGHVLDFSHLLLTGNSAGGYCAAQLALSHPDEVSAVGIIYPALDMKDPYWYNGPAKGEPNVLRFPDEDIPRTEDALLWAEEMRKTVATKDGFDRTPFCVGLAQHGLFMSKVMDPKSTESLSLFPLDRIQAGARLPKALWLMHGDDDATVPIRGSDKFVDLVTQKLPGTTIRYDVVKGQDHAFDVDDSTWASFADSALEFVAAAWLSA